MIGYVLIKNSTGEGAYRKMKEYMIVTNDKQELPVVSGLCSAREVGEYLGISENTVRSRLRRKQKRGKYKIIQLEKQRKSSAEYCKKYDMTHDRSEYFRKRYRERKGVEHES